MNYTPPPPKVEVIKANRDLKQRIGPGSLEESVLEKCETVMAENEVDFAPLAQTYLNELKTAIHKARQNPEQREAIRSEVIAPVMQLKANAGTFKYQLITKLANIMLGFVEAIPSVDATVIEIIDAHHKTLTAIITRKLTGDGGQAGQMMAQELEAACKRYFSKNTQANATSKAS